MTDKIKPLHDMKVGTIFKNTTQYVGVGTYQLILQHRKYVYIDGEIAGIVRPIQEGFEGIVVYEPD